MTKSFKETLFGNKILEILQNEFCLSKCEKCTKTDKAKCCKGLKTDHQRDS